MNRFDLVSKERVEVQRYGGVGASVVKKKQSRTASCVVFQNQHMFPKTQVVGENAVDEAEFLDAQYVVILFEGQEDDEDCSLDLRKLTDFTTNIESAHNIWCYNYQLNLFCLPRDVLNKNMEGGDFQNDVLIFSTSERHLICYRISQFFGKNRKIHNDSAIHDKIKADALSNIKRIIDNKMQYYTTRSSLQDGEALFQADDPVVAKNISATLK